ncbi:ABC transporter ATP-binding protein [[Clostridium] fimetarium]|uniref:ABC-type multidrug transport system, ATPase and permease component n=1 Tax=[Clostridium] fimetarium TaxID=99656 RepID=A0A1I0M7R8_9FIRM|nr:ABC transporter ATP-binding protein [[Clostridium] fimetarium]SEV84158.1 ABC-type multidrug transport system, ATPase and permease component [[Clostridium] fimetarium]
MRHLLVYLKDYKKESILAPLFKMLEALFELFVPLVMALIIDNGIANGDKGYIVKMCTLMVALAIIGLVCSISAQFFAAKAAVGFSTKLRHELFHHIQNLSFTEMDTIGTSTLITRMTSDVNQVQAGVNLVLRLFLRSPFIVFGAMIMAFTINAGEAFIFVITIPILSIVVFGIMFISMPMYKKVQANLDKVLGITRQNLTGARVIRAFGNEKNEIKHFQDSNQTLTNIQKYVGKISGLMNPITYVIINVAIIALIWHGALKVEAGNITQGQLIALVSYMSQILVELVKLANLIITVTKALACANRIEDIFEIESSMKTKYEETNNEETNNEETNNEEIKRVSKDDSKTVVRNENLITGNRVVETKNVSRRQLDFVSVEFKHVSLTYKNAGEESLTDLNFKIKSGQTVGIIGGTGSGKSSIVNLIPRFYDATNGAVLINGIDVKEYSLEELRDKIGVVMQKAVLFKGTIRENLLWGNKDATEDEINQALIISQAKEFVDKKSEGLESFVDQGGKNLSGGQKQRLTIARAIIKDPEILILDDSASALDFATDANLRKAIQEMNYAPTVFIVSQRASSIQQADQIIVLDDGSVVGIGTHNELIKNCDVYQEIYFSQVHHTSNSEVEVK